jgi:DNA-binding CsgD family transcriptional regulator
MTGFVLRGRAQETTIILRTLRSAMRSGAGSLLLITGEPGIGKTAVVRNAVDQALRAGFATGVGKAEEIEQIAPGAPLLLALRSGPQPLLDSEAFADLASLYDRQLWLVERISVMLEDRASHSPVLLAIDDVQWADQLTRFALRVLPGRLAASPVVWLLASRLAPGDVAEELAEAAAESVPVARVPLGGLEISDIDNIARDRLSSPPTPAVRALLRGVAGNPFWAVQVCDGLAWRRAHGLATEDMHAELIEGVRRRLEPLDPATVALVRLAAVWGRVLAEDDAAILLGRLPAGRVILAARDAENNGLLTDRPEGLEFAHDLVRDAVYADIPQEQRDELHRACGRHLLSTRSTALAAAPHFLAVAAQGDAEVVEALLRAASDSAPTMPDQTAELAQLAFSLAPAGDPLWLSTGQAALAMLIRVQREGAVIAIADRLIAGTKDNETSAELQVQACRALWSIGACTEIERRVDLTVRRDAISPRLLAQLAALRALASTRTESAPLAAVAAMAALTTGRDLDDELTQRVSLHALTEAARNEGRHQQVLDWFTQLRGVSPTEHLAEEIRTLQHLDRYAEADALLAKIRHEANDDIDKVLPSFLYAQIWQDHNLARLDAADAGARTLQRLAWEIGNFTYELNARMVLAGVAIYRGDLVQARNHLHPVEEREESRDELRASRLRLMQGWLLAEEGNLTASLDILRPLMSAAPAGIHAWSWSPPWMRTFAGIGRAAGDEDFEQATVRVAELGAERNPGIVTMSGVALQVRGFVERDAALLAQAVEVLRGGPRPMLLAQAIADHAEVLRRSGSTAAAEASQAEANARFDALGAVAGALSGAGVHGAAGRRQSPTRGRRPAQGPSSLTETEAKVARLVGDGHSSRSAAAELGVSPNTVNTHLRAVFAKLDVRSRVQLSNYLRDHPPGTDGHSYG